MDKHISTIEELLVTKAAHSLISASTVKMTCIVLAAKANDVCLENEATIKI